MWLYFLLIKLAALFNDKARRLVQGERQSLDLLRRNIDSDSRYIWFHAASVGEFEQARPVIEKIKDVCPQQKILLTFFSPSGYEMRKDYKGADFVSYLPFATTANVRQFLDIVLPQKAIFVKYEFWPAYLRELRRRSIPTYIFAAIFRPNQLFFKPYGRMYRQLLTCFTTLMVQDEASKLLLGKYGINNTVVAGDPRFDRVVQIAGQAKHIECVEAFAKAAVKRLIVAGSTWHADEKLLIRYMHEHADCRLLIVPHEIDEHHLDMLKNELGNEVIFYTDADVRTASSYRCMVLNAMGLLSSVYRYGQVAYVGGGFGDGIHNTLEAAVYCIPVVFGPKYKKFREACQLIDCGGGYPVRSYEELERVLDTLLSDCEKPGRLAGQYVAANCGATDIIYKELTK